MKHTYKLFLLAALVALTSCGKDDDASKSTATNPSVTPNGFCTAAHVNDYNRVNRELREIGRMSKAKATEAQLLAQLRVINAACDNFLNTHNPATQCVALVNKVEKLVDGQDLVEPCKKAKELLQ